MNIDPDTLAAQYERAARDWPFLAALEVSYGLPRLILSAVGSRETNLTNEVGDGGHGHGVWQLDDRSHQIPAGFDADVHAQAVTAASMLRALITEFHPAVELALVAYNAGAGTAAYNQAHGLPPDTGTANGDYSTDVIARRTYLINRYPAPTPEAPDMPDTKILEAHGASVQLLVSGDHVRVFTDQGKVDAFKAIGTPVQWIDLAHFETLHALATPL